MRKEANEEVISMDAFMETTLHNATTMGTNIVGGWAETKIDPAFNKLLSGANLGTSQKWAKVLVYALGGLVAAAAVDHFVDHDAAAYISTGVVGLAGGLAAGTVAADPVVTETQQYVPANSQAQSAQVQKTVRTSPAILI